MVAVTFALSALLTGVVLIAVAVALVRGYDWRRYSPSSTRAATAAGGGSGGVSTTSTVGFLLLVVLGVAAGAGAGGASGGLGLMMPVALFGSMIVGFLLWGVYNSARFRGMGGAQAIGTSAWVLGLLLIAVIVVMLVLD